MVIGGNICQIMSKKKKVEIKTIEDRRGYILWRRVSTKMQGESFLGLEAQETIAKAFMGKDPVDVYTDVHTGTKLKECVGLWEAIKRCKENDLVLVIAKTDRFRSAQEALEVLDAVGERNLIFCDLPSCDRFILTVMFAMHERTAMIGRINTRVALAERKRQIERDGGFFSKSGNWCTHLGGKKGDDLSKARAAAAAVANKKSSDWRDSSPLYSWAQVQYYKKRPRKEILEEAEKLFQKSPEIYCTRQGKMLTKGILSVWVREWQMS